MTDPGSPLEAVAQAIREQLEMHGAYVFPDGRVYLGQSRQELNPDDFAAAVLAVFKQEHRNVRSICDMSDTAGIDEVRWVSSWTSGSEGGKE